MPMPDARPNHRSRAIAPRAHNGGSLELFLGHAKDEAIERVGHLDLAAQAAGGAHVKRKVQHVLLHLRGPAGLPEPRLLYKHVTGGTRARPAALGLDALHHVLLGLFHDGHAVLGVDHLRGAVRLDERDLGHAADFLGLGVARAWLGTAPRGWASARGTRSVSGPTR